MVLEVTRYVSSATERELWARAAGRCQFNGCNKLLYISSITQESVNLAQKAHIYSFSDKGPRGWGPFKFNLSAINELSNLMLLCHGCHQKIDADKKGDRYSADLLIDWKNEHEQRIEIVGGIAANKKSNVVIYGASIGTEKSPINYSDCIRAMFPDHYPALERPELLSMNSELKDCSPEYWNAELSHLRKIYERKIIPLIEQSDTAHFSVFAFAPQPLLILLGALFTDKISVEIYQLHREPKGWRWVDEPTMFSFIINTPQNFTGIPVLLVSLSDHVAKDRVSSVLGDNVSIWEITVKDPHNDFMQSKYQLSEFRRSVRRLMVDIKNKHGNQEPLHVFPVMPVSCAIELGRARMPKADMLWILYDQNYETKTFQKSLEIASDI